MDASINPSFQPKHRKIADADGLFHLLREGNKPALAQAITLIESNEVSKYEIGREIVKKAFPFSGKSKRIGITGVPGAGKSTFIESFGKTIADKGRKLAVLAIDPSSTIHKGSILGDKTRMQELSVHPNVFIRPTPSGTELGGVARHTYESMILCEAAGYDHIFVETVGVGQSETEVKHITDFFILLMIAGAGDELQGIKRGIMEMADLIVVNKADGSNLEKAKKASKEIENALMILGMNNARHKTKVQIYSSTEHTFQNDLIENTGLFFTESIASGTLESNRKEQLLYLFNRFLRNDIIDHLLLTKSLANDFKLLENKLLESKISPFEAIDSILKKIDFK